MNNAEVENIFYCFNRSNNWAIPNTYGPSKLNTIHENLAFSFTKS